jgi:zinc finger protein
MTDTTNEPKQDGAAFDDYFESIQKKAETLSADPATATETGANGATEDDSDEPRVVDEIESLCMNCHENVSVFRMICDLKPCSLTCHRELLDSC